MTKRRKKIAKPWNTHNLSGHPRELVQRNRGVGNAQQWATFLSWPPILEYDFWRRTFYQKYDQQVHNLRRNFSYRVLTTTVVLNGVPPTPRDKNRFSKLYLLEIDLLHQWKSTGGQISTRYSQRHSVWRHQHGRFSRKSSLNNITQPGWSTLCNLPPVPSIDSKITCFGHQICEFLHQIQTNSHEPRCQKKAHTGGAHIDKFAGLSLCKCQNRSKLRGNPQLQAYYCTSYTGRNGTQTWDNTIAAASGSATWTTACVPAPRTRQRDR